MQMNNAILRNNEIVTFDKKKSFFFQPAGSETSTFFFHVNLIVDSQSVK